MSLQSYVNIDSPDPVNAPDLATKNYVDTKPFFTTATITGPSGNLPVSTSTQITAWGTSYNYQRGAGTWSAGVYTVGLAGIYSVRFQLYWSFGVAFTTDTTYGELIARNGTEICRATFYIVTLTTGVSIGHLVQRTILFNAGDTISFYALTGPTGEPLVLNNANTFVEIAFVQP